MASMEELQRQINDMQADFALSIQTLRSDFMEADSDIKQTIIGIQRQINMMGNVSNPGSIKINEAKHLMPSEWANEKGGPFQDIAHDIVIYMTTVCADAEYVLEEVLRQEQALVIDELKDKIDNIEFIDRHLYAMLSRVMRGESKTVVKNANKSGVRAWYSLNKYYDPRTTTDASVAIQRVLSPVSGKDNSTTKVALEKFETDVREREARFEQLPDSLKIAGLKNLMPETWFDQHFKGESFKTYQEAKLKLLSIANDRRLPKSVSGIKAEVSDIGAVMRNEGKECSPHLDLENVTTYYGNFQGCYKGYDVKRWWCLWKGRKQGKET